MQDWTPETLQENLDAGKAVFLKLWKPGCGACKLAIPATDRLALQYQDQLLFAQIDAEAFPEMLDLAKTEVLPIFFLFKNYKMAGKHIGFKGLQNLKQWLEEGLSLKEGP